MYLNRCNLIGRLVANPEFTKSDNPEGATDRVWGRIAVNRPGSETADFVPFVAWGATARAVSDYCVKGRVVVLDGQLRTRSTQREDGSWDNYFEVNCSAVYFGPFAKDNKPAVAAQAEVLSPQAGADTQAALALLLQQLVQAQTKTNESDDPIPL